MHPLDVHSPAIGPQQSLGVDRVERILRDSPGYGAGASVQGIMPSQGVDTGMTDYALEPKRGDVIAWIAAKGSTAAAELIVMGGRRRL
jgi:hypothetical protein